MTVLLDQQGGKISARELNRLRSRGAILLRLCHRPRAELSILLVDDDKMRQLNAQYRHQDRPTNVLAFPQEQEEKGGHHTYYGEEGQETISVFHNRYGIPLFPESGELLGDVVISLDTAAREAETYGITLARRLTWLLTHGLLHLLGRDHERSPREAAAMAAAEEELLRKITIEERRAKMIQLAVNVDHVATLRQARGGNEPDPVLAAGICELAGAAGIVIHLREDRRHIQDRDLLLLRQTIKSKLNLEMGAAPEIIAIAHKLKPDMVTLVPEKRRELTTEGGLNVAGQQKKLAKVVKDFKRAKIPVSLFIDPDPVQIGAAAEIDATFVEIHTGRYCDAVSEKEREGEFELVATAAEAALAAGLKVNAGHGLNYLNTGRIAALGTIEELSIGHAIMARAIMVGLHRAVREMLQIIRQAQE